MSTVNGGWQGPVIVKEGLSLYLDAGSPNSFFNKTGTFIKDMSGGISTGSLTNGALYDTSGSGSIFFDGTNDWVITNHRFTESELNGLNVTIWINPSARAEAIRTLIAQGGVGYGAFSTFYIAYTGGTNISFYLINTSGSVLFFNISQTLTPLNTWTHISANYNSGSFSAYTNGILRLTGSYVGPIRTSTGNYPTTIGSSIAPNQFFSGSIGITQVYNRALTPAEILQNYNATKGRFGL